MLYLTLAEVRLVMYVLLRVVLVRARSGSPCPGHRPAPDGKLGRLAAGLPRLALSARAQGLGYPVVPGEARPGATGHRALPGAYKRQAPGSAGRRAVASQGPGAPRTLGSARTVATAAGLIME